MANLDMSRYKQDKHHQIVLSFDLGKMQDYTAFTISEVKGNPFKNRRNKMVTEKTIHVRDIQRLPLGTTYDRVGEVIHGLVWEDRLRLLNDEHGPVLPVLLVDVGGVGDAVADDLARTLGVGFVRYRLVRGTAETKKAPKNFTVPRTVMFEQLYAAFAGERIHLDPRLQHAKTLLGELRSLRPEMHEETGHVRIVHREGEHDDLAICLASTNWWANRRQQPLRVITNEATVRKLVGHRCYRWPTSLVGSPSQGPPSACRAGPGFRTCMLGAARLAPNGRPGCRLKGRGLGDTTTRPYLPSRRRLGANLAPLTWRIRVGIAAMRANQVLRALNSRFHQGLRRSLESRDGRAQRLGMRNAGCPFPSTPLHLVALRKRPRLGLPVRTC